jgi:hypothetical protein
MPGSKTPSGKTPNRGKFVKGQSGNLSGRPKGAVGIKTLLAQELKSHITISENGTKKRVRRREALAKGLVNDALRGRDRPRETVLRYADAMEQDQQQRTAAELSAENQAILDRYVQRRIRELECSAKGASDEED